MTELKRSYLFLNVNFPTLVAGSCLLPLTGLVLCESLCLSFDFRQCTITKCGTVDEVWNFLPSISVATGLLAPQKYIWRILIALHATPRFLIAAGYHSIHTAMFHGNKSMKIFIHLSSAAYFLHLVEILALVGLSFVSSTEDYDVHKLCFVTFMFSASLHMIFVCILHSFGKKVTHISLSKEEKFSLKCKFILFVTNAVFFAAALYFFHRHNTYCEDGVYSLFGLCEIVVVVTNIAFHGTAIIDFRDSQLVLLESYHADYRYFLSSLVISLVIKACTGNKRMETLISKFLVIVYVAIRPHLVLLTEEFMPLCPQHSLVFK